MNHGKYIFSQITGLVAHKQFQSIVDKHKGDYKTRDFTCWKQFLCMVFGQLTHRESISDSMLCLKANSHKLYHMGIGSAVAVSTLTRANENRSYLIYEELALSLIIQARALYTDDNELGMKLDQNVFALDATTIDLCLSTFYWAAWRRSKAGIRLHTQLDLKTSIPRFILFTNASVHDVNVLDVIDFESNSFYVMDRGYLDYKRLYIIHLCQAFFVTRAKAGMACRRIYSHKKEESSGVVYDQTIKLSSKDGKKDYPEKLRRIKYKEPVSGKLFVFLTNNFELKASEVAELYKNRWKIELFFKWIKQHLKITSFWGHSENAVKTQVWIAVATYVLIAITKKKFVIENSLYELLQVISISIFDKTPVNQLFDNSAVLENQQEKAKQLKMWE